ncbi:MAG: bifunctional biotin--[acetyl-CoA-carboxylase] synthetase/biotin operon repressor, partial [Gammaproteobacteria bacterium]
MTNLTDNSEPLYWKVLSQLADGQLHSGQAIAKQLGVTRAAIWKALKKLEQFDILVEHQRGVGYKLAVGSIELLDLQRIWQAMPDLAEGVLTAVHLFRDIRSTNQYMLDEQIHQAIGPVACFAEYQSAGRGRRG